MSFLMPASTVATGWLFFVCFFFKETATAEIYTRSIVGSVRCVQETGINAEYMGQIVMLTFTIALMLFTVNVNMLPNMLKFHTSIEAAEIFNEKAPENSTLSIYTEKARLWNLFLYSKSCLLYTSPSPRDLSTSRMPSSA
eukprot:TRINITY_DN33446_c0_g1_i1.p1 TRINITY_DN33446_c0_g1~~TRINITY_DN33446_c0_g1_i1.p1  ORF type:complete len:140 (-),score=34.26 TRINITY_DN33446_c0_g1_i1:127-546(-)